ncbi:MCE family protein [[Mycobacterium] wendilense]|uniref:MCE family protein n=1 Tax=[Mycobacterium] wendilense TaxID=3064284 RepID=A0ABM9MIJ7_9MYCO|nr:MCE family protein [Mycolicibacterium sp. MU0050]CAJ1586087.1 MCE family protein [Mycolicibacterium sp. MU0050]
MISVGDGRRDHPAWWGLGLLAVVGLVIILTVTLFAGTFRSYLSVTLLSDRAGLVMESGGKVKMRGVVVGRVAEIHEGPDSVSLALELDPKQVKNIPANVQARIRATTAFGAKFVDLLPPPDPSTARLAAGAVLTSQNVSTEVNTVFQNLTELLGRIEPTKLNAVLSAVAEGLRGKGSAIRDATASANQVLAELNTRDEVFRRNWRAVKDVSDAYGSVAQEIIEVLDAASVTGSTIAAHASDLDRLLVSVSGLSISGTSLLESSSGDLIKGINSLEPTTQLLMKYNPQLTCTLVGAKLLLDPQSQGGYGWADANGGRDGRSTILDVALLLGDDQYRYPDHLPVVGAKGGPGGKPGCGSLPDVSKKFPVQYLVTNTGWGTGMDVRPNPGIAFPGFANYFPVTRGAPDPASVRNFGGPAPGPQGVAPFGAPLYAPDGTPLYPGLPPAPPPGAPREQGPTPGSEPFVVENPMQQQPTPAPPLPTPAMPTP